MLVECASKFGKLLSPMGAQKHSGILSNIQYIPRNMHTVLLCCALLWLYIDWFSQIHQAYFIGTVAPVPAKQPWWIWINTSGEFIMNDCITTTKQSTTKPCSYFLGYTVWCCLDHMRGSIVLSSVFRHTRCCRNFFSSRLYPHQMFI